MRPFPLLPLAVLCGALLSAGCGAESAPRAAAGDHDHAERGDAHRADEPFLGEFVRGGARGLEEARRLQRPAMLLFSATW